MTKGHPTAILVRGLLVRGLLVRGRTSGAVGGCCEAGELRGVCAGLGLGLGLGLRRGLGLGLELEPMNGPVHTTRSNSAAGAFAPSPPNGAW